MEMIYPYFLFISLNHYVWRVFQVKQSQYIKNNKKISFYSNLPNKYEDKQLT